MWFEMILIIFVAITVQLLFQNGTWFSIRVGCLVAR